MSWAEIAMCQSYAEEVIRYSARNNLDLSCPDAAMLAVVDYNCKGRSFKTASGGANLTAYLDITVDNIGFITER